MLISLADYLPFSFLLRYRWSSLPSDRSAPEDQRTLFVLVAETICLFLSQWIMSEFLAITAAAAARIIFAIHGIAAIWRVALVYKQNKYWFQAIT